MPVATGGSRVKFPPPSHPPSQPPPPVDAHCIDGYYPLYDTAFKAESVSPAFTHHTHVLRGHTYYMPDGFVNQQRFPFRRQQN